MSSLKDLASLIMVPSLVKDGRLDTVKPLGNSIIHPDATGNNDGTDGSTPAEGNFTFSRGSNLAATRVDVNGLIEKGRENLVLQSNQFDTTWSQSGVTLTGGQTGYDGSSDAWEMEKGASSYRRVSQSVSLSGVQTLSVYAKANTQDVVSLWCDGTSTDPAVAFNLTTLSWVYGSSNYIERGYESVGNGWYRVWMSYTNTISQVRIYVGWNDSDAGSIYIQDAQLESSMVATDYIETGASTAQAGILEDLPRLDYSGGASCPALLLEPQRQNLFLHSEYLSGSFWFDDDIIRVQNTNETLSPEGVYNAVKLTETATNARHRLASNTISVSNQVYTASVFLKKGTARYGFVHLSGANAYTIVVDLEDGTITDTATNSTIIHQSVEDYGNGWYRCSVAGNMVSVTTAYVVQFGTAGSAEPAYNNYVPIFLGSTSNNIYAFAPQVEAGSYPTSYIPTMGSAVTRSADNIAQLDLRPTNLTGDKFTYMLDITLNTAIATFSGYFNEVDSGGNFKAGFVYSSGLQWRTPVSTINQYITLDSQIAVGDRAKMLVVVDGIIRKVFYNGSLITTLNNCDNNGADTDGIRPYYGSSNAQFFSPSYNQILVFDTALTDSECIALTTI